MSYQGNSEALMYHEVRQGLLEKLLEVGLVSVKELESMSEKEQNVLLVEASHDCGTPYGDACGYCLKLYSIGLLEGRDGD